MTKVRSVRGQRTARGFTKAVRSQGGHVQHGGRHSKLVHPEGGSVPIPMHSGDIATGTSYSIVKMLLAIGFICVVCLPCGLLAALQSLP